MNTKGSGALSQANILAGPPLHLRPFVQTQDYQRYSWSILAPVYTRCPLVI